MRSEELMLRRGFRSTKEAAHDHRCIADTGTSRCPGGAVRPMRYALCKAGFRRQASPMARLSFKRQRFPADVIRHAVKRRSHVSDNRSRPNPRQGSPPAMGETQSAARRGPRKSPTACGGDARHLRCASPSLRISTSGSLNCPPILPRDPIRPHFAHSPRPLRQQPPCPMQAPSRCRKINPAARRPASNHHAAPHARFPAQA